MTIFNGLFCWNVPSMKIRRPHDDLWINSVRKYYNFLSMTAKPACLILCQSFAKQLFLFFFLTEIVLSQANGRSASFSSRKLPTRPMNSILGRPGRENVDHFLPTACHKTQQSTSFTQSSLCCSGKLESCGCEVVPLFQGVFRPQLQW